MSYERGGDGASMPDAVLAIEDNYVEAWSHFGRHGGEIYDDDSVARVVSRIPHIPYNGVIRTRCPEGQIDEAIRDHKDYFAQRGIPMLWAVTPSSQPHNLPARLAAQGFSKVEQLTGMSLDLSGLPDRIEVPPGTEIRSVDDHASLRQYVDMIAWKWHLPPGASQLVYEFNRDFGVGEAAPGRRWLAYQNGVPVAKAFIYLGVDTIGVYGVASLPEVRRQGLGTAITLTALLAARRMGYRHAVLHSTAMGESMYARLGFEAHCHFHMFARS